MPAAANPWRAPADGYGVNVRERRRHFGLGEQLRVLLPLFAVWGLCSLGVAVLLSSDKVSRAQLFLDSTDVIYLPWYTGLLSTLGVLLWTVAASVGAVTSYVARMGGRRKAAQMMAHGALVGAAVCIDDLFELHSSVIPKYTPFPKPAVLAMIAALAISWVIFHLAELLRTRWQMLVASFGSLMLSIGFDALNDDGRGRALILEDGAKLLGILAWTTYFVLSCHDILRSIMAELRSRSTELVNEKR